MLFTENNHVPCQCLLATVGCVKRQELKLFCVVEAGVTVEIIDRFCKLFLLFEQHIINKKIHNVQKLLWYEPTRSHLYT